MFLEVCFIFAGVAYLAAKGIHAGAVSNAERAYIKEKGFNMERQHQLGMMVDSYRIEEREEFDKLLGRVVDRKDGYAKRAAIKEIAEKEGWTYFDPAQVCKDPRYVKMIGGKIPDWDK